jgi:tellurite resistance protein TehA-like permease
MAAGILSIAARSQNEPQLSDALLFIGLFAFGVSVAHHVRAMVALDIPDKAVPVLVLFTWVAACGVLSQRLDDVLPFASSALALLAVGGLVGAFIAVARALRSPGPTTATNVTGSWLLASVAFQTLSILCSDLRNGPFTDCAVVLWLVGIAIYGFVILLILRRLARRAIGLEDLTPDYWIAMGGLAISTVAATKVHPLAPLAAELWVVAAVWIPYLCVIEAMRVRRRGLALGYDPLRWSTVFPLGMFSVATHDLGVTALQPIAAAFLWAGLAVGILNLVAGLTNLRHDPGC